MLLNGARKGLLPVVVSSVFWAAAANAGTPNPGQYQQIQIWAFQLQNNAVAAYNQAVAYARFPDADEQQAISSLYKFGMGAQNFNSMVQSIYTDPSQTEDAFTEVSQSFEEAQNGFGYLNAYRLNPSLYTNLGNLVSSIKGIYTSALWNPDDVIRLIQHTSDMATDLMSQADQEAASSDQHTAANGLHQFERTCQILITQVQRNPQAAVYTQRIFFEMMNEFQDAKLKVTQSGFGPAVNEGITKISDTLGDLSKYYAPAI